ncbi:hypothetical protein NADFUDRAFT_51354 [Nadsonia fulvescens var. elongata DSM 6958]|uniref:RRM domain-containing protein n=1 Tax=Nadsonia fulvescens var. elongata DSM 6958 TaxID=857566 RepID=A0A1E3PLL7_9ASCO|nr:hypothetical protein NADFUDRAFT_51354 [Nadsonia fulvescens var. elongata DSM 6958]
MSDRNSSNEPKNRYIYKGCNNRYQTHQNYNLHTRPQHDFYSQHLNYQSSAYTDQRSNTNVSTKVNFGDVYDHRFNTNPHISLNYRGRKTESNHRKPPKSKETHYQLDNQSTMWRLSYDDSPASLGPAKSLSSSPPTRIIIRLANLDPKITVENIEQALKNPEGSDFVTPEVQLSSSVEKGDNFRSFYSDLIFTDRTWAKNFLIKFPYITIIGNRYIPVIINQASTEIVENKSIEYSRNKDVSSKPSKFLIIRNLPKDFTPDDLQTFFYKRLSEFEINKSDLKANKNTNVFQKILKFIMVYDRYSSMSSGFGFLEFLRVEDSSQFLKIVKSTPLELNICSLVEPDITKDKFSQSGETILVDFIHLGVFLPVNSENVKDRREDWLNINHSNISLIYRDNSKYMRILSSKIELQAIGRKVFDLVSVETSSAPSTTKLSNLSQQPGKVRKRQNIYKNSTRKQLLQWQLTHKEIHNYGPLNAREKDTFEFLPGSLCDPRKPVCLLCMRQFGTSSEADSHEKISKLHNFNKHDSMKLERALKLIELIKKPENKNCK